MATFSAFWNSLVIFKSVWTLKKSLFFTDDEPRRPGQRLPTSMLGNEVTNLIIIIITTSPWLLYHNLSHHNLFPQIVNCQVMSKEQLYDLFQIFNIQYWIQYSNIQVMSKEQLYDLFQQILNVKKFEHQLLYNAMQVWLWWWWYRQLLLYNEM